MKMATGFTRLMGLLFISSATLVACADNAATDNDTMNGDTTNTSTGAGANAKAEAALSGTKADTTVSGTVSFEAMADGKVRMNLQISVPKKANSSVAMHLHEHGDCGDTGTHAGGHWNPTGTDHGKWGEGNYHSGDIGNISLDAQGNGSLTIESDRWSIGGDAKTNILEKSVIIHSGVDDYKSQPAGDSGPRIGCGIIRSAGGTQAATPNATHSDPH